MPFDPKSYDPEQQMAQATATHQANVDKLARIGGKYKYDISPCIKGVYQCLPLGQRVIDEVIVRSPNGKYYVFLSDGKIITSKRPTAKQDNQPPRMNRKLDAARAYAWETYGRQKAYPPANLEQLKQDFIKRGYVGAVAI